MGAGSFQTSQEQAASHPRRGRGQPEGRPPALSLARAGPGRPPEGSCGAPSQSLTPPPALTSCRGLSTLQARLLERGRGRGEGDNRCSSLRGKEPRPLRGREPSPREWGPILTPHVRGAPRVLRSRRAHPSLPRVTPPPGAGGQVLSPTGQRHAPRGARGLHSCKATTGLGGPPPTGQGAPQGLGSAASGSSWTLGPLLAGGGPPAS